MGNIEFVFAWISFNARDDLNTKLSTKSGTANDIQPIAGLIKSDKSLLSLPFVIICKILKLFLLLEVSCAIVPAVVIIYWVITLSLWSWSTTPKFLVVGQISPNNVFLRSGITTNPELISLFTSAKKANPLQYATCPKIVPFGKPLTQLPTCIEFCISDGIRVIDTPFIPIFIITILLLGRIPTTGEIAGCVPISITNGL